MIDQNRARCLAPKPEPAQARPWVALWGSVLWRIQEIERTKRGERKCDIRRLLIGEQCRRLACDQAGIDITGTESFEVAKRRQKLAIGDEARNPGLVQARIKPVQCLIARCAMGDDLGDHRIVERRDRVTGSHTGIDTGIFRRREQSKLAGRGQKSRAGSSA